MGSSPPLISRSFFYLNFLGVVQHAAFLHLLGLACKGSSLQIFTILSIIYSVDVIVTT